MKKIILTAAIALGSLTAMTAQETTNEAVAMNDTEVEAPVSVQEKFSPIEAEKLPDAVKEALATDFKEATLQKAFVNESSEYKLVIMTANKAEKTVYATSEGEWIERK